MQPTRLFALSAVALAALLAGCASSGPFNYTAPNLPAQPEGASGWTDKPGWATEKFAVAAANPLATDAGYQVLKAGGSAVDAAIAVQMVLGLVEPQSSGIAGGAFLMLSTGRDVEAWDGRETAPAAADEKLFLQADGKPMPFPEAVVGGRSVGVPGAVRMLEAAHKAHGKLAWADLFKPAVDLAERGFQVSPRLNTLLQSEKFLKNDPVAAKYFYDASGQPWPVGHVLKNPEYAHVLRGIAARGSVALLEGPVAQAIVDKVNQHPTNPGQLSLARGRGLDVQLVIADEGHRLVVHVHAVFAEHAARAQPRQLAKLVEQEIQGLRACGHRLPRVLAAGGRLGYTQSAPPAAYFGARRMAPSRRITSPFSMSFSTMCLTSFA